MKTRILPLFTLLGAVLSLWLAACSKSAAALPAVPAVEQTEVLLADQEKTDIKPLLETYVTKQSEATDAQQRLRGAEDVLKAQHKLGDKWQDALDGQGSIKFVKPPDPAPSASPGASPAPGPTPEEVALPQNEREYLRPLIDTAVQKQMALNDAMHELRGALGLLKKQHKLDDGWQDAADGSGSIKFVKKPAAPPSPNPGAASAPPVSPAK